MRSTHRRTLASTVGGVFVALVLFLVMNALITGGRGELRAAPAGQIVDLIRVREEEIVQTKQRVRPKKPPPAEGASATAQATGGQRSKAPERPDANRSAKDRRFRGPPAEARSSAPGNRATAAPEGELEPIVRINPQYPREALADGTEGFVKFEVLIGTDGRVVDVKVTEAAPGRVFVRSALRAVRRWVFKPRVVDGTPVERWAKTSIVFELDE